MAIMPVTSNATTGNESALARQPTEFNYSQSNQFKVQLSLFPKTEWFLVRANIPGVNLGQAVQATSLIDMPLVGDKLTYDQFYFTFIVDEKLENYMELHDWLINIGFPRKHSQFQKEVRGDGVTRPSRPTADPERVLGFTGKDSDRDLYSDINLFILSSKNNPVVLIKFFEAFPVNLTNIEYSQQESDTTYAECTATFSYTLFTVEKI
tara:strand:- start:211 stop:834 length:624 start_codon:yes stop_codon:yes gene_type:complete